MKRGLQKIAVLFLSTVIFVSYLPWNVAFAEDEGNAFSLNVITDEAEGENGRANPEGIDNSQEDSQNGQFENSEASVKENSEESKAEALTKTLGNDAEENDDNLSKSRRAKTRGAKSPEDYFVFNEQTKTIVGYSSDVNAPKAIKILATINGINVEHISTNAFAGQQLTGLSFELPSNLKSIGSKAFCKTRL